MKEQHFFGATDNYETDLEVLFEVYHDGLLLVIWRVFPDWKIAEEILSDVYNRLKKCRVSLPEDEEQLFATLAGICRKRTIENIPFLSGH
ncbi:MAG: hypothetical protein ABIO46_15365 [Chitinophagales bacterium]